MLKIITTKSGKRYGYDSLTGKIITIHLTEEEIQQNISDEELIQQMIDEKIVDEGSLSKPRWMFSFDEYIRQLNHEISGMVLALTDFCNLRCSYCSVSGGACDAESGQINMSEETLFKSLDFFIEHNADAENAHIGFYGGEALLKFSLIKKSVTYLNQKISNKIPTFDISTNGLLLTDEVAAWLSENSSVQITCTVNGPFHDKYRKTPSGNGSLDIIVNNLLHIKRQYPDVWNNQMRFIANVDFDGEIPDLLGFYDKNLDKLPGLITNIRWGLGICPMSEKQNEPVSVDFSTESPVRDYYLHSLSLVKKRTLYKSKDDALISSCFPCKVKLFVLADGRLSFCEQVNYKYSIGDIENGFNTQTLRNLYEEGERLFSEKCRNCWAQRMCNICFSALIDCDGHILPRIPDELCKKCKASTEEDLRLFCQLSEEAPELIDKM